MSNIFALVDCNNFYASCERVFQPSLKKRPVVVLSNNDGCIVARSNEAKDLCIAMGTPFFKAKDIIQKNNVAVMSSNGMFSIIDFQNSEDVLSQNNSINKETWK